MPQDEVLIREYSQLLISFVSSNSDQSPTLLGTITIKVCFLLSFKPTLLMSSSFTKFIRTPQEIYRLLEVGN